MTKQEKHAILRMISKEMSVHLTGSEYVRDAEGNLVHKEVNSMKEIDRLSASEDFKLGWQKCHKSMAEMLSFIMTASNEDLIKYAGRAKRTVTGPVTNTRENI